MSTTLPRIGRGTYLTHFVGPSDEGPDRHRWEVHTDAQGMNRQDVLALIASLSMTLDLFPAPDFYADLKFANDTTELAQAELARVRAERDEARADLRRIIEG